MRDQVQQLRNFGLEGKGLLGHGVFTFSVKLRQKVLLDAQCVARETLNYGRWGVIQGLWVTSRNLWRNAMVALVSIG